jgi:hypothetical protein
MLLMILQTVVVRVADTAPDCGACHFSSISYTGAIVDGHFIEVL